MKVTLQIFYTDLKEKVYLGFENKAEAMAFLEREKMESKPSVRNWIVAQEEDVIDYYKPLISPTVDYPKYGWWNNWRVD